MVNKWAVYAATYATYSVVHSIRTCWASLKTVLNDEPYQFSQKYLGALDMMVLFTIAILLNIFGGQVQKHSRRKLLFGMMGGLIINLIILFIMLDKHVTSKVLYFIFYGTTGILSCLAWPICLYTTAQYFDSRNATALSMWSSVSQCGDFVAFLITLIVLETDSIDGSYSMLFLAIVFILVVIYDYFFFRDRGNPNDQPTAVNQVREAPDNNKQTGSNTEMQQTKTESDGPPQPVENPQKPVNFLTVWLLPGVALPVLAFSTVKSINAIVISWLVMYLTKLDMIKQSRIIAIAWTFSIVVGGFIGSKINGQLSYKIFLICLFVAGFVFCLLEELHVNPNHIQILFLIIACAILVGGPYNQLGTAVPLKLSQDPYIRTIPKAKSMIISLMEGFAQFICGIAVLIVPSIGIIRLHYMAGGLCFMSVALLLAEEVRIFMKYKPQPQEVRAHPMTNAAAHAAAAAVAKVKQPELELKQQI